MRPAFPPTLTLALFIASACSSPQSADDYDADGGGYDGQYQSDTGVPEGGMNEPSGDGMARGNVQLALHPVMDPKTGMALYHMPLPNTWRIMKTSTLEEPSIVGPGGVKVYYRSGGNFTYSNDPYIQQSYQMSGQPMRAPVPIETLMQQDLGPQLQQRGMRFVKQYPLPQIAARNRAYSAKLFKAMPSQDEFYALGSEWRTSNGQPLLIILNLTTSMGQNNVFWYYNMQILEAEQSQFDEAKRALLNGIINTQDNPQQLAAYNASEQQKTNQSWSQHNARMQQNQQNFDRQQALHRSTWDAVNSASMNAYNDRNASSDNSQRQFLNYINDENTVSNSGDGQRYQVESGADQYWMNNNGEYIPSNDAMYDPNADNAVNNQSWQEVEVVP